MPTRARPGEAGESLVELILAVAIMGITVVAIVGGIVTSILVSDIHRKQATAGAYVRSYAEAVSGHFDPSPSPSYPPAAVGVSVPSGFRAEMTDVQCWDDLTNAFGSCGPGSTVQRVTLTVSSTDSRVSESVVVVVRKP